MSLRELTLEGEVDKVAIAIKRLQTLEPPEGYYLAFSGGKDSVTILDLAKRAGVKFDAHYHLTTVDPPELVRFIRTFPEVAISVPDESMWQLIKRHGMLPTRTARFCCQELKENGGEGRLVVTGVRWAESIRRRKRKMVEPCMAAGSKKTFLHPIIDWTTDEVWEYCRARNLPNCHLYLEGWDRLGCVMCPNGNQRKQAERWPKIAAAYRRAANEVWSADRDTKYVFKSGDEYYEWWITGRGRMSDDQLDLGIYE